MTGHHRFPVVASVVLAVGLALAGCSGSAGSGSTGGAAPTVDRAVLAKLDGLDKAGFLSRHPGVFVTDERSAGMESVSVLSYDPAHLPPPARQDTVGYGHLGSNPASLGALVYEISVLDGASYYVADFDPVTRARVFEEGAWFLGEDKGAYAARQLGLLADLLGKGA